MAAEVSDRLVPLPAERNCMSTFALCRSRSRQERRLWRLWSA